MASKNALIPAKHLFTNFRPTQQSRCMATLSPLPTTSTYAAPPVAGKIANPFLTRASVTSYHFPSLEPHSTFSYPSTHLLLPLRKDILHNAIVFEAASQRDGTAHTKHRSEVHGSGRKIRPQKGTGSARLGDKKSPSMRGGGRAHGPKNRDMSQELPKKVYDLAFRTALSVRYRRGELVVVEGEFGFPGVSGWSLERYVGDVLRWNGLKTSMMISMQPREEFFEVLEEGRQARGKAYEQVRVKDLLRGTGLVIERLALEKLFREHQSDLRTVDFWQRGGNANGSGITTEV